ncbi:hypothetical protein [Sulfurimonas sp.]|uniref:hypothetical protein n=1 Tax=Sulfurimonas sp. TaxID=2022749 RepID=UPI002B47EB34|nr:hypothetical protein [Sulfurimonas sp.]
MKVIIKTVIILLSLFISLNAKDVIKVESIDSMFIKNKNGKVTAKILFDKNFKGTYEIKGVYKPTKLLSGKNKIDILWTEIQKGKATIRIKKPLNSILVTSTNIEANSIFKAQGDIKSLNNDLNTVSKMPNSNKSNSNKKDKVDSSNSKNKDDDSKNKRDEYQSDYSPTNGVAGTLATSSGTRQPSSSPYRKDDKPRTANPPASKKEKTVGCDNIIDGNTIQFRTLVGDTCINKGDAVPIEITTKKCNPIIDYKTKEVFVSSRKVAFKDGGEFLVKDCTVDYKTPVKLQSKTVGCDIVFRKDLLKQVQQEQLFYIFNTKDILIGSCVDSDITFDVSTFIEINKECSPLINYKTKKVQFGYRTVANVEGSIKEIKPCAYEKNTNELISTYEDCQIRDDFTNKISVQQEKFYYMFENKKVFAGECKDSSVDFRHYITDDTCTPKQIGDDKVVFEKRVAYRDVNNIVKYITKCQPSTDGALELYEEFCGYEHDFNNHQSYPKSRKWFKDPDTDNKKYLTQCLKQPFNFPHKQELIRWENDDIKLTGTKHVKLFFTDNQFENTDVYISDDGSDDVALAPQPYVKSVQNLEFVEQLGYKRLDKVNDDYIFYGDDSKVIDFGGGLYPTYNDDVINITTTLFIGTFFEDLRVTYSSCSGGDVISSTKIYKKNLGIGCDDEYPLKECYFTKSYTHKDCRKWNYYEKIDKYNLITDFLRPDSSIFHQSTKEILRVNR